jgi:uncharacterized BrkB/YihY/UPF0761 family membrane protein
MEIFLIIATVVLFVFGVLLLLSPETVLKVSAFLNRVICPVDEEVRRWRRPIGIFFLALTIFLWYVILWKLRLF